MFNEFRQNLSAVIKLLTSMKTALVIMVLLIISSIIATFIPNSNLYQTFWYKGLLLSLCLSLLFCTVKRLPALVRTLTKPPKLPKEKYNHTKKIKLSDSTAVEKNIIQYFKQRKYRIQISEGKNITAVSAYKGLFNYLAPHALHLSLVIIFLGAFINSFGVSEDVSCFVGESVQLPAEILKDTTLKVDDFKTMYDSSGNIDNWQSDIALIQNGQELTAGSLKVNQPFKYQGAKFYQSGYGYEHLIKISGDNAGSYSIPTDKPFNLAGQTFVISQSDNEFVLQITDGFLTYQTIPLKDGKIIDFADDTAVEYQKLRPYTVLNVKRVPGAAITMSGFFIAAATSLLFWSKKFRKFNVIINHQQQSLQITVLGKNKAFTEDLKADLVKSINQGVKTRV